MEQTISDLQEQVDAALGAEEMVENLTTKCLDLEDRVAAILEEKMDLEVKNLIHQESWKNNGSFFGVQLKICKNYAYFSNFLKNILQINY